MEEVSKYFTISDRFLLLGSEKIYLQFFVEEIGSLPIEEQLDHLISNLSDPGTNFPYLCSIYYLISEHKVSLSEDAGHKHLSISLRPQLISSLRSLAIVDLCLEILTLEVPKEEDMIHFRIKILLDLVMSLICGHFGEMEYQLPNYPGLINNGIAFCFKCIKLSQERMDVDLRRISALLMLFFKLKFRERLVEAEINVLEVIEDEDKIELFNRMKKIVEMDENEGTSQAIVDLVKQCHFTDVEEWYISMITEPSNPLPTVLVVGYLRALLNLVTTCRAKNANANYGYDCTSELESTYNYMNVYKADLKNTSALYRNKVEGKKDLVVQNYLFYTLALDKIDTLPEINQSFLEMKLLEYYKEIYSKDRDLLPDNLSKEIEDSKEGPAANQSNLELATILSNEVYTHRTAAIYFITRTLALIHKVLKSNNFFQALSLGTYIYDAKGILVMLKIISEKILLYEGKLQRSMIQVESSDTLHLDESKLNPVEGIVEDILYIFFNITIDYPDIVSSSLNEYKAHYALKKYPKMFPANHSICNYAYLIIKKQMDLMPKKVKSNTANMSIVSHNYNAVTDNPAFIAGIDGPSRSVSQKTGASSANSFAESSNMGSVRHFLATYLKDTAGSHSVSKKFESTHEVAKKLCSSMIHIYLKWKDKALTLLAELSSVRQTQRTPPSTVLLYNELYGRTQIPENFDLFYKTWLEEEVFGYLD